MNRFQVISVLFVIGLLSCNKVECGSGTVEQDGKCVVVNKTEVECGSGEIKEVLSNGTGTGRCIRPTLIKDEAETNNQRRDKIQSFVDKTIESWQDMA